MTKEELKEQDIRLNKLCFDYQEREKRIAELEKENAELKKFLFCKGECIEQTEQLTKAKELLTKVMKNTWSIDCIVVDEINAFLNNEE